MQNMIRMEITKNKLMFANSTLDVYTKSLSRIQKDFTIAIDNVKKDIEGYKKEIEQLKKAGGGGK